MRALLAAVLAAGAWAQERPAPVNRLLLGGDVMLSRYVGLAAHRRNDPLWPFRKIADQFRSADLAFVNLESPFADKGPYFENRMVFRAHPSLIEGLRFAGIDVVSTANNHARDAGGSGLEFTLRLLAKHGIHAAGTGLDAEAARRGVVIASKAVRFGFLAYTYDQSNGNWPQPDPRVAMMDAGAAAADIASMRSRADVVIVSMHAGWEYVSRPNAQQIRFARAAIDAGAAVVVGHHPHIIQPVEQYGRGLILYSLGNLIFDQAQRKGVRQGAVAELVFEGATIQSCRLREVVMNSGVPEIREEPLQCNFSTASPKGPL